MSNVRPVSIPPPLLLAHAISPALTGLDWVIGGSVLLHHLGIEPAPADLDIVTTEEHFPELQARLAAILGNCRRPSDPSYMSKCFASFESKSGVELDAMPGIAARTPSGIVLWSFSPSTIAIEAGLPWMRATEWRELYALFGRPARVAQIEAYLGGTPPAAPTRA